MTAPVVGASPAPPASIDEVLALVRARGGRVTSPRRVLLEVLFRSGAHRSAEDLAAEVQAVAPDVHLSTIYRNLDELERLGVVVHSHFGHGAATYHLAGAAHAHFSCEHCGAVVEVPPGMFERFLADARRAIGFEVNPYHFAIAGRCAACAAAQVP